MDPQLIGNFLKELRKENNMTQEQLAESLNISSRTVSRWETGKTLPDMSLLVELSALLNVSVNEIISAKRMTAPPSEDDEALTGKLIDYAEVEKDRIISDVQINSKTGIIWTLIFMVVDMLDPNIINHYSNLHSFFLNMLFIVIIRQFINTYGIQYKVMSQGKNSSKATRILRRESFVIMIIVAIDLALMLVSKLISIFIMWLM